MTNTDSLAFRTVPPELLNTESDHFLSILSGYNRHYLSNGETVISERYSLKRIKAERMGRRSASKIKCWSHKSSENPLDPQS